MIISDSSYPVIDKIVSIEMIEAVGHDHVSGFFNKVSSLLRPSGLMALQGITYNEPDFEAYKNSVDFIKKYIFLVTSTKFSKVTRN